MIGTVLVGAEPLADLEPVDLREHDVEHDEVDLFLGEALQRLLAVARLNDAVAVPLERIREELLDRVLVVDEQNGGGFRHRRGGSTRGRAPATPYYSPRRGGLRLTRAQAASEGRGAPAPPRRERRARRGSLDQPINGRLVRAWSLLLLGPLLLLALTIGRPGPFPGLGAAAVVRRPVGNGARGRAGAATTPIASPDRAGAAGRRDVGRRRSSPSTGSRRPRTPGTRRSPGSAASGSATSSPSFRARRPDAILVLAHRDDIGVGPGRERQRLRHGGPDRAGARLRPARHRRRAAEAAAHARSSSPPTGARTAASAPSGSRRPRRFRDRIKAVVSLDGAGRHRHAAARAGRIRAALAGSGADPDGRRPGRRASSAGRRRGPAGSPSSSTSAMPFGYGEQAPFLGRKISAIRLAHRRRTTARRPPIGHAGAARPGPVRPPRAGRRVDPRLARRRHRARRRDRRARLPRQPDHPWLGDRARPARRARPLPRRRDRPLRPQPAAAAAAARRLAGAADAVRRLALVRAPRRPRRARRRLPARLGDPAAAGQPRGHRLAGGRARRARRCSRRSAGGAPAGCSRRRRRREPDEVLAGYAVALLALGASPSRRRSSAPTACSSSCPSLYAWLWLPQVERRSGLGARRALRDRARRARARRRRDRHAARARAATRPLYLALADDPRLHPLDDGARADRLGRGRGAARCARGRPLRAGGRGRGTAGRRASALATAAGSRLVAPAASVSVPRGTWTIASAAVVCTIMCDSWPTIGSSDGPASLQADPRADEVVALRPRPHLAREDAGPKRRRRVGVALEREQRRADESRPPTSEETGFPGRPKTSVASADAEGERLAGTHRDAPEHLLDAEPGLDPAHEVVRSDRDAAGGDDDVRRRAPASSAARAPPRCPPPPPSRSTTAPALAQSAPRA